MTPLHNVRASEPTKAAMLCNVKSCCIFFPLRQSLIMLGLGSLVIGFLGAGISLVNLVSEMDDFAEVFDDNIYCDEACTRRLVTMSLYIMTSQAVSFSLLCLCAMILLAGVILFPETPGLLVPYLIYLPLDIVLQLIDIVLFTVLLYSLRVSATRTFFLFAYWFVATVFKFHFFTVIKSYQKQVTGASNGQVYPRPEHNQSEVELQNRDRLESTPGTGPSQHSSPVTSRT